MSQECESKRCVRTFYVKSRKRLIGLFFIFTRYQLDSGNSRFSIDSYFFIVVRLKYTLQVSAKRFPMVQCLIVPRLAINFNQIDYGNLFKNVRKKMTLIALGSMNKIIY